MTLISFLPKGRDRAIPISELAESARISRRKCEKTLESLVLSGIPIVACESGVYVTDSPQEARAYAQSLKGRIVAVQARVSALERWSDAQEAKGQPTLWEAA
jgi:hypothetical protein